MILCMGLSQDLPNQMEKFHSKSIIYFSQIFDILSLSMYSTKKKSNFKTTY